MKITKGFQDHHIGNVSETSIFPKVGYTQKGIIQPGRKVLEGTLEVIDVESGVRNIIRHAQEHFEAPNWSRDGKTSVERGYLK